MRYKAIVSYDGSAFDGWQIQKNGRTVQQEINKAISKITNQQINIVGSGRTDSKVHAKGQTFHFDTDKQFKDIAHAINSQLPEDIFIRSVEPVDDDFHARYSVKWKHYDYVINNGEYSPLLRNYSCFVKKKLNIEKMKEVAQVFIGEHDFTSFNSTSKEEIENQVRTISKIDINCENDIITLSFYGDGFLRYMVRMISQTIIEAGLERITVEEVEKMLLAKSKTACNFNGEGCGLYLVEVGY